MIYDTILKENKHLEQTIPRLKQRLADMPEGNLVCCHHGNSCKWYISNGCKRRYIPKSNRELAEQLALKKYYFCELQDASQEHEALAAYLKLASTNTSVQALLEIPGYQDLLSTSLKPLSLELQEWASSPYEKNPAKPEKLIVPTIAGHMVRSKSEAMIVHCLYTNKIPYRYEAALQLGSKTFYPDFTIRHPRTGKIYYWEHFGLMDNPEYCRKTGQKIYTYSANGITPSIELITTYEKESAPLSTAVIEKTIADYFL